MIVEESPALSADSNENKSLGSELCDSSSQQVAHKGTNVSEVLSTPTVRNLAKQYGININDVPGTGKDGRVLREDVHKYLVHKGIIEDTYLFLGATSAEGMLGQEDYLHASAADELHYEDKTILLRYYDEPESVSVQFFET